MHVRKRIFSLFLAFVCAFFTGCNSIIYNGNINFEAFEPETIPAITNALKDQSMDQQKLEDMKKYEISGRNAFYILPSHENRPDQVIDFKVLDYTSGKRFIYAYLTPYYGAPEDLSGLNGNATTGKAPEEDAWQTPTPTDTKYNVTVLMSYDPETRDYQVFFSALSEREEKKTVTNQESSGEVLTTEINSGILHANRLVKREEYFIFHNMIAYVYDSNGKKIQSSSLAESVSQEITRLKQKAADKNKWDIAKVEESIMDVTMDGYYCVYIPVTLEVSSQETQDEDSLEAATYSAVINCYCLDIGGESSGVVFVSSNENWEKQKEIWLGVAKDAEGNPIVFESEDDMMAYAQHYSMDNLKLGSSGDSEDRFGVFRTQQNEDGTGLHLELAAVELLEHPVLAPVYSDNSVGDLEYFEYWTWMRFLKYSKNLANEERMKACQEALKHLGGSFFEYIKWMREYKESVEYDYEWVSALRKNIVQLAQGDPEVILDVAGRKNILYYLIPWYAPGRWQAEKGQNDLLQVQGLFGYRTSVYQTENGLETVGRYHTIEFPDKKYGGSKLGMTVKEWTEPLERTWYYYEEEWVEEEVLNEDETVTKTREKKKVKKSYTETAKQYPLEYQLILPEGARSFSAEVLETDEMVDASGDLGAIYYMENKKSGDTEDATSRIRYHDGNYNVLVDTQVPGKAIDAGILHYDAGGTSAEIALYVTDSGIKFYERGPEGFFGSGKFVTQEEMSSPTSIYGVLKLGDTEQTDAEMEISDTEDAIIQNKMKSGAATEVFEIANFSMLNRNSILVSSLTSGMLMTNYRNGLNVQLESGAYYASFPCKDEDRSPTNKEFMVVGYRTEDYVYQPSDLVRAKCYRMDLGAQTSKLEKEAFEQYVDGMVSSYLNRRYRMEKGEDGQWKIMQQTDVEKAQNVKMEQLLFEADDSTKVKNWLVQLAGELGISSVSNETVEAAVQLRNKFLTQKEALKEFYMLAGLGSVTELPTNAEDLEKEGLLISAGYVDVLKQMLVDMKLSEKAIEGMQPGEQKVQYAQYRQQKLQSALLNERGSGIQIDAESGTVTGTVSVGKTEDGSVTRSDKTELEQSLTALSQMEFYDTVLQDVQKEYERRIQANPNPLGDLTWDEYLVDLLKRISPDNSINQKEQGLQELCALAGLAEPMVDMEQLAKEVSELYRTEELEELIIGYKVDGSAYQSRGYRVSFAAFQEKVFATKEEKKAELHASDFYQVIKDIIASDETLSTDPDEWEKCLTQILGKCGAGIVLETGTAEE